MDYDKDDDLGYVHTGMGADLDTVLIFNLLRTHNHLNPFIDAGLRAMDLTGAQFNALLVLHSAGDAGLLMGEIGQKLVVTKSNVTGLVNRLEREGLAVRASHQDGRVTIARITDAGRELLDKTAPHLAVLLGELTDGLTFKEKSTLVLLLTKLRRNLRARRKDGTG